MCTVFSVQTYHPNADAIEAALKKTETRGPDDTKVVVLDGAVLGFQAAVHYGP